MLTWIKNLFRNTDRADRASERIAAALEEMADLLESGRDALRARCEPAEVEGGKRKALK